MNPDNPDELQALVESLLFVAEEPITINHLAQALGVPLKEIRKSLKALDDSCQTRGLRIQRQGQRYRLVTAPEAAPYIERLLGLDLTRKLSPAALETLAIVAYRQPVTRMQIEAVRGVDSQGVLRTLVAQDLIAEMGRLDQVGRPILYGTTFEFLQYFGLDDLSQLPPVDGALESLLPVAPSPARQPDDQVQDDREEHAEHDGGDQGEDAGQVPSPDNQIAGQPA